MDRTHLPPPTTSNPTRPIDPDRIRNHHDTSSPTGCLTTVTRSCSSPEDGTPYHPDTLTRRWSEALKRAGVRHIRLHDARHTCGTTMHLRKVPLAVIAAWLGHADASTTAMIYTHSQVEALREAAKTLGEVVTTRDIQAG
ncbi:tyrosine-type recombinase/integrase [Nocardia sp. NPDC049190]|uniref:tyrosine-type recombinase/integrase n=1 Tax=Nocardia sp. NPDC049190 TaxID=3155650 RepID=UPI003404F8FB